MNPLTHTSSTLADPSLRSGVHERADQSRDADLYTRWNVIFERARAVEHETATAATVQRRRERGFPEMAGTPRSAASVHWQLGDVAYDRTSESDPARRLLPADAQGDADVTVVRVSQPSMAVRGPLTCAGAVMDAVVRQPACESEAPLVPARRDRWSGYAPGEIATPMPIESIRVFVAGDAVTIVVRNRDLSFDDALSCAFEAVRDLTGDREQLHRLTLNGQTLYDRIERDASRSQLTALVAAC